MSSRRSRAVLWTIGGALMIGSIAAGVEIVMTLEDKVADMVRTPSGCESEVAVTGTGEFFVYVETSGRVGDLGPCGNDERLYSLDGPPTVEVSIAASDGRRVEVRDDTSVEYDTGAFAGRSLYSFSLAERDTYTIAVQGDRDAVVAVGRNVAPEAQIGFIITALVMLAGIVVLVIALAQTIGSRRRSRRTPVVLNYADGTTTWAPPSTEDAAFRGDAGP